jgi:hypothetical protein
MKAAVSALAAVFVASLAVAALSPDASAEEVVLVSGARYPATQVEVDEDRVTFTANLGSGDATLTVPTSFVDPLCLYGLVHARTKPNDAIGQLRLGKLALGRGRADVARERFERAAALDPTLAEICELALGLAVASETRAALAEAERLLRAGLYAAATAEASRALALATPGTPEAEKAAALERLARRLAARVASGAARPDPAPAPPPPPAEDEDVPPPLIVAPVIEVVHDSCECRDGEAIAVRTALRLERERLRRAAERAEWERARLRRSGAAATEGACGTPPASCAGRPVPPPNLPPAVRPHPAGVAAPRPPAPVVRTPEPPRAEQPSPRFEPPPAPSFPSPAPFEPIEYGYPNGTGRR